MRSSVGHCYEFGPFHLNPCEQLLLRDQTTVPLPPRIFALLLLLVQRHGHLIAKEELLQAIWPDACVEEGNLTRNISTLRQTLGEHPPSEQYILTVPRRGYRFVADVRELCAQADQPQPALLSAPVRSMAVLPFKPLLVADRDEAFELGLADTLITRLSGNGRVQVSPTNAIRKFTGLEQDAVAAGHELAVEAVLDGAIQRSGARLRVTARLLRVRDGMTLWAGQCDELFSDLFSAEDAIASELALALAAPLAGAAVVTEMVREGLPSLLSLAAVG